jgi:hypothetical protein
MQAGVGRPGCRADMSCLMVSLDVDWAWASNCSPVQSVLSMSACLTASQVALGAADDE